MTGRLAVVFDCMIYLQGLIKETGPAVECLELFERGVFDLIVSEEILDEVTNVLARPKLRSSYTLLTDERSDKLREMLRSKARLITKVPSHFSYPRDPKDEKYINLAVNCEASYIVSRDRDLLT